MRAVDLEAFRAWCEAYAAAWRSNEPEAVAALFAQEAVYSFGPFREPTVGRAQIVRAWVEGGVPEGLDLAIEPLAVTGRRGVAHFRASFAPGAGTRAEMDGILACEFDDHGRCTLHREWFERREHPA
jgi:hypothetical protein